MDRKLNWFRRSAAYAKAKSMVKKTIQSPEKLLNLIINAKSKTTGRANDKLSSILEPLATTFRLLKAYAAGEYRKISTESLALIVASIIYLVMPLDALPDFIIGLGFIDDAALLGWTLKSVAADLENFIRWEQDNDLPPRQG